MGKFTDAATTSQTLSIAALEEASRFGQRTADIDHLFLALVINEQVAGQALRNLGITLETARAAVAAQHAEQLTTLGIAAKIVQVGRIVFHETDGYKWGQRSLDIIKRAAAGKKQGDAAAVLLELLAEPSGLIAAVLGRLGTTCAAVRSQLRDLESNLPHKSPYPLIHGPLSGALRGFAPADTAKVWLPLSDPAHMPVWEPALGSATDAPIKAQVGDCWTVHARTERPNGKPLCVKPDLRRQRVELMALTPGRIIEWRFTYPDAPKANARRIRIELQPTTGGTQLQISLSWQRDAQYPRSFLRGLAMRPVARWSILMQLLHLNGGISRVFR